MVAVVVPSDLSPAQFSIGGEVPNQITIRQDFLTTSGAGAPAAAPAADDGPFYIDTSTSPHSLYYWDGTVWNLLGDGVGAAADGNDFVTGAALGAGNVLTLTRSDGGTVTVDLSSLAASPAPDGVLTGATLDASNVLTLTNSVGAPVTVDLSALAGGGGSADGVVTSAVLDASNILTLTRSVGAPVTVDLSSLAGGGGGGVTSVSVTAPITNTGTAAVPNIGIDFSALSTAQQNDLVASLCANVDFQECIKQMAVGLIRDDGDGTFTIAHTTDGAGNYVFVDCP